MSVNTAINSSRICSASTELNPSLMSKTHVHLMEKIKPISVIRTAILIDRKYYFQLNFFFTLNEPEVLAEPFLSGNFLLQWMLSQAQMLNYNAQSSFRWKTCWGQRFYSEFFFFYWRCITQNCIECHRLIVFSFSFNIQVQQFCFKYALWRFS